MGRHKKRRKPKPESIIDIEIFAPDGKIKDTYNDAVFVDFCDGVLSFCTAEGVTISTSLFFEFVWDAADVDEEEEETDD